MNTDTFDQWVPGFVNAFGANTKVQLEVSSKDQASFASTTDQVAATVSLHVLI